MEVGNDTKALRAAHVEDYRSRLGDFIARLNMDRAAIDGFATSALRRLLLHARDHSSWHAQRLRDIDIESLDVHRLDALPTMTKNDLMTNWDDIVTVPGANLSEAMKMIATMTEQSYVWGDNTLFSSGGSSGRPGAFLYSWDGVLSNWSGMTRSTVVPFFSKYRGDPKDVKMSYIGAGASAHGSYIMGRIFSNPDRPTKRYSLWQPPEEIVAGLNEDRPHILYASGSMLPVLCQAAESGKLDISPILIFSAGEYLSEAHHALAQRTWPDADILCCWGSSEGAGTFPCPTGHGFHVSEDLVAIEPAGECVDGGNGTRIASGILVTNFYNLAMPIIRIHIDDCFEFDDKACGCGSSYQKVAQVHGRSYEAFRFGDQAIHPAVLELSLLHRPEILEYQIRQNPAGVSVSIVTKGDGTDCNRIARQISEELGKLGVEAKDVTCIIVDRIERTSTGKLKRFVPLQ